MRFQPDVATEYLEAYLLLQEIVHMWQENHMQPHKHQCSPVSWDVARVTLHQIRFRHKAQDHVATSLAHQRQHALDEIWKRYDVVH